MQRTGQQLLSGSGLAQHQHRSVRGGDLLDGAADLQHAVAAGNHTLQRRLGTLGAEAPVFLFQFVDAVGTIDDQLQHVGINRLVEEVVGAHGHRAGGIFAFVVTGNHNDLGMRCIQQDIFQQRKAFRGAIGIRRQAKIERDDRRLMLLHFRDRVFPVARDHDIIAFKTPAQLGLQAGIILNDQ